MAEVPENKLNLCESCRQPTERRCSACKLAYYCNPEHQKHDWKDHKNKCRPFEVFHSAKVGKSLRANRDLNKHDMIFSELPLVFGPKLQRITDGPVPCVGCCLLIELDKCAKCPDCLWPACSSNCVGLKNNSRHGLECRILKLRSGDFTGSFYDCFRFDILIALRALFLQKVNRNKWKQLLGLEAHMEERGPETEIYGIVDEKVNYLENNFLKPLREFEKDFFQTILEETSNDLIHKIYGILDVNAVELTDGIDAEILYPTQPLIEHNCTPNTHQIIDDADENYKITIRASLPIKKGDNITSSYTHILWGTHARRQDLKESKYFWCDCNRCKDPTELGTFLSGLRCLGTQDNPCGGIQLPINPLEKNVIWLCDKCNIQLQENEIIQFVNHLGGEVENILETKPSIQQLEELMEKLLRFLHPNHYHLYQVKHTLIQLYNTKLTGGVELAPSFLKEKIKMCEELLAISEKIDPGNSRLSLYLGVILHELFEAKFKLLIKVFDESGQFAAEIEELSKILERNGSILQWDAKRGAGKQLLGVVQKDKIRFEAWLKENSL